MLRLERRVGLAGASPAQVSAGAPGSRLQPEGENRARALEIHGTKCKVCDFDFNEFYGPDLARDYIEVHHTKSVAEINGEIVDPQTDLAPICSNCHSMAHRERGRIIPIEELRVSWRR